MRAGATSRSWGWIVVGGLCQPGWLSTWLAIYLAGYLPGWLSTWLAIYLAGYSSVHTVKGVVNEEEEKGRMSLLREEEEEQNLEKPALEFHLL
jgi:hypothetical protein